MSKYHFALLLGSLTLTWALVSAHADPQAMLRVRLGQPEGQAVELVGLNPKILEMLGREERTVEQWSALFAVYVVKKGDARPSQLPVGGTYRIVKDVVRFEPRYPLANNVTYRAVVQPGHFPGADPKLAPKPLETELALAKPAAKAATVVESIFPSADRLPENQLKFYLHFSAPMSRGEAYQRLQLLDEQGKAVQYPFLELDEELWDPSGKRFTVFFDPGRIKRGLKPREDLGPVLEEGKRYTLVIDRRWNDATGQPLKETVRKTFQVLAPEDRLPDPKTWKLETPSAGTTQPLVVIFPRPLDHALLHRLLWVESGEKRLDGSIKVSAKETRCEFTPKAAWTAGSFNLVADKRLEDLAGNSIGKAFEVDVFRPVQREIEAQVAKVAFVVR
jgi:hypothetical protein